MTDEQEREWIRVFGLAGIDLGKIVEFVRQFDEAMQILAEETVKALGVLRGDIEEALEDLESCGLFDYEATARKKKRERDRRTAAKSVNTISLSRYNKRRLRWAVKRQARPRPREREPPSEQISNTPGKEWDENEVQTADAALLRKEHREERSEALLHAESCQAGAPR